MFSTIDYYETLKRLIAKRERVLFCEAKPMRTNRYEDIASRMGAEGWLYTRVFGCVRR